MVYRLDSVGGSSPKAVILASYDHANQYESHGGADSGLYGGKGGDYAKAVAKVIGNDPPGGLAEGGKVGGFKVVQSDQHQVVYGADKDGLCKYHAVPLINLNIRSMALMAHSFRVSIPSC